MTSDFMKDFLDGEKSPEEKSLLAAQEAARCHDVLHLDLDAYADEEEDDEEDILGCDLPSGGCGGCACRR